MTATSPEEQFEKTFRLVCRLDDADIDYVLETLPSVVSKLRGMSPLWDEFQRGTVKSAIRQG